MRESMLAKSVSVSVLVLVLVLGLSANSFATDANEPESANSLLSIFQQGTASGYFRALSFNRFYDQDSTDQKTIGFGGHLKYETAPLAGFNLGIDFKTGQGAGLNSDDDAPYRTVFALDADGNVENYAALDEYYLRYTGYDTTVTLGAQYIFTPAMRGRYSRLTQVRYQGLGVVNKSIEKVELYGYYIDEYIGRTEEEFKSVSSAFTRNEEDDEGAFVGGVIWRAPGALQLQFWDYYYPEVMNQYYFRGRYNYDINDDLNMTFDLRYFGMKDAGDALAGDIDTYTTGAIVGLKGYGFSLTGYFATNGDDRILDPFDAPLIVIMQGTVGNSAELDVWSTRLAYDFGKIGVKGLRAYVYYGEFDTPDEGENASSDVKEIDFSLGYKFSGWAEKMKIRARYAIVNKDESVANGEDFRDFRTYLDFEF